MRLLLDTHALLWMSLDDPKLTENAKSLLADPNNDLFLSPATYWEVAIKVSIGSYELSEPLDLFMNREIERNDLTVLPIGVSHATVVAQLPFHHRDPFDRMIIAQAKCEGLTIVGKDEIFDRYSTRTFRTGTDEVRRLWSRKAPEPASPIAVCDGIETTPGQDARMLP